MYCHAQTLAASLYQTMSISSGAFRGETRLNASHLHGCSAIGLAVMEGKKCVVTKAKLKNAYSTNQYKWQYLFVCMKLSVVSDVKNVTRLQMPPLCSSDPNPSHSVTALRHATRIVMAPNSPEFNCD